MKKTVRHRIAEWVFNRFLKPFEKVVIAQKVLAQHGTHPETRMQFEKAFGVTAQKRSVKQWNNLVRVYGIDTVAKIEGISENQVKMKCKPFSEQLREEYKMNRI